MRSLILGLLLFTLVSCQDATKVTVKVYDEDHKLESVIEVEVIHFHLRQTPGIKVPEKQKVYY